MKIIKLIITFVLLCTITHALPVSAEGEVMQVNGDPAVTYVNHIKAKQGIHQFNDGWKFNLGEVTGANELSYNDTNWSNITLPHDYSLIQEYSKSGEAESGYKLGGVGWYRKSFTLDESAKDSTIYLNFDGSYMLTTVFVNGKKVAFHTYGYTPFTVDITSALNFEGNNVIAIRTDNPIPSSRWYSGSGIYRDLSIEFLPKTHFVKNEIKIKTPNLQTAYNADSGVNVNVIAKIQNETSASKTLKVVAKLVSSNSVINEESLQNFTVEANSTSEATINMSVVKPHMWNVNDPFLHQFVFEIYDGENLIETKTIDYGFRFVNFDKDTGFSLNGSNLKLKGVCMHHDQGALGSKGYYDAMYRQVKILKDMGVNSIRVTHNPASRNLIDIANKEGILLIDEAFDTWLLPKNANSNDYSRWFNTTIDDPLSLVNAKTGMTYAEYDLKEMVRRGVNDPSIIMWSMGNEVQEGVSGNTSSYPEIIKKLINWTDEVDGTRHITLGDNTIKNGNSTAVAMARVLDGKSGLKGIVGYNYANATQYEKGHNRNFTIYGSETASSINSRGVYKTDSPTYNDNKQLTAYDTSKVGWGALASEAWFDVIRYDYVAGEYIWTGFDYLGEPTPHNGVGIGPVNSWPSSKSSYFGIIDTAGFPKDSYYLYRSLWNESSTTLHVLPAWKSDEVVKDSQNKVDVVVYSNANKVELVYIDKNGAQTTIGTKEYNEFNTSASYKYKLVDGQNRHQNLYMSFKVPYKDGTIKAIAYDSNNNVISNTVGRSEVTTYLDPTKMKVSVDKNNINANNTDLSYVEITILDSNGNEVANASNLVNISVEGPGELVGMDNGKPNDHQSYQDNNRHAFSGKVLAIVKSTYKEGDIKVNISSEGLEPTSVTIKSNKVQSNSENNIVSYEGINHIYLKKDGNLTLPTSYKVNNTDGTSSNVSVNWKEYDSNLLTKVNSFSVNGTLNGINIPVSISVDVIDEVSAILNYSTAVKLNDTINLPEKRPALMADGTFINALFDVNWESFDPNITKTEGVYVINGTANVMGKNLPVSASVRVANLVEQIGSSVSNKAASVTQDIPSNLQSDTLASVNDTVTQPPLKNTDGPNPNVWTNYDNSQKGDTDAEIEFKYDTAQNLGKVVIYFYKDGFSARVPSNVELFYSLSDSSNYQKIEYTKTETNLGVNYTKIEYALSNSVPAVLFKVKVVNSTEVLPGRKPCTGISEIELLTSVSSFKYNTEANLTELIVNDEAVSDAALESKSINTEAYDATVKGKSNSNASITVLSKYNDVIKVITESEDNQKRSVYSINLKVKNVLTADNASNDVPYADTTIIVDNFQDSNHKPENLKDNNPSTIWHTKWSGGFKSDNSKRYILVELKEETLIDALRYLPRQGSNSGDDNGRVASYKVEVSTDGTNYTQVTTGEWNPSTQTWKMAEFTPVKAKYVKLYGLTTSNNGSIQVTSSHMSAAEIRVRKAVEVKDITTATITFDKTAYEYTKNPVIPNITVSLNETNLRNNVDYYITLSENINKGVKAKATITGISKYSGTIEKYFVIKEKGIKLISTIDDIKVTTPENFEKDYEIEIKKYSSENQEDFIDSIAVYENKYATRPDTVIYEINLFENVYNTESVDRTKKETIDNPLEFKVIIPEKLKGISDLDLYRVNGEELVKLNGSINENILTVNIDHFSQYVLAGNVDKSGLTSKIEEAKSIDQNKVTPATFAVLTAAITKAETVNNSSASSAKDISDEISLLESAIESLLLKADTSELKTMIETVENLNLNLYTPNSKEGLDTVLAKAKDVMANLDSTQQAIEEELDKLKTKYEELVPVANKKLLSETIELAKKVDRTSFTKASLKVMDDLIASSENIVADLNALQIDVDNAKNNLSNAISGLIEIPNLKQLKKDLEKAKAYGLTKFDESSTLKLKEAINKVEEWLKGDVDNGDTNKAMIDEIDNAIKVLKPKVIATPIPSPTPSPTQAPSPTQKPAPVVVYEQIVYPTALPAAKPAYKANNTVINKQVDEKPTVENKTDVPQNTPTATPDNKPQEKVISTENQTETIKEQKPKSNIMLYVGGLIGLASISGIIYMVLIRRRQQ